MTSRDWIAGMVQARQRERVREAVRLQGLGFTDCPSTPEAST